jgi:hypothetical protein
MRWKTAREGGLPADGMEFPDEAAGLWQENY